MLHRPPQRRTLKSSYSKGHDSSLRPYTQLTVPQPTKICCLFLLKFQLHLLFPVWKLWGRGELQQQGEITWEGSGDPPWRCKRTIQLTTAINFVNKSIINDNNCSSKHNKHNTANDNEINNKHTNNENDKHENPNLFQNTAYKLLTNGRGHTT